MKDIVTFIEESQNEFPISLGEFSHDSETAEVDFDDLEAAFFDLYKDSNANAIVRYSSSNNSATAKRMEGLMYEEVFKDAKDVWNYLNRKDWGGFQITLEDDYVLGVTFIVSGPRQTPSDYLYFSKLNAGDLEEMIEEEDGEAEADKTYIKLSKYI